MAVKQPWRESNRRNALGQIILKNAPMNKLAAEFGRRNMLFGYVFTYVRLLSGLFGESEGDESDHDSETDDSEDEEDALFRDLAEAATVRADR